MKFKTLTIMLLCISSIYAQNAVTPGTIQIDPTFEHIGILYNISGDGNLNSHLQIEFREQGSGTYQNGAITMRSHPGLVIDGSAFNANHHAGSAMFLEPNTTYDIRLTLTDPDGGNTTTSIQATTKAYPTETSNYQHVAPGNGGGNGTSANPYLGLQAASDNAQPGTTFIVRPGTYTSFNIATDGTANAPITFRSETPRAAIIDGANTSGGVIVLGEFTTDSLQHIIIDGFKIQNGNYGIDAQHTQFITIKNCWIEDVVWGFYNRRENGWEHDQYITNNYIEGRTDWTNGGTSHRAIDIRGNRNVISFNTIRNFDDGVSTDGAPYGISYAMDIHNNDIQNMADDLIEVDGAVSNTRIYRNRMYNARAGVSLAPVFGGPCYVFRNEMYNMRDGFSAYKMNRSPAGLVIVHNSSAKIGNGMSSPSGWQNTFFKNNVVMGTSYCFEEYELVSANNDWDYNAYYSTRPGNNVLYEQWFKWNDIRYGNLSELQAGTNIETNGIIFDPNTDIVDIAFPANDNTEYTPDDVDFQPTSSAVFRNNGIQLDNLNDEYVTDGQPDRGAYEYGSPLPQFGSDVTLPQVGDGVTAGSIRVDPTFEHIGILYNISGDGNLNSSLQIEFREQGNGAYQNGAITMRSHPGLVIDGSIFNANHHAGSAMFLRPNTTYDIRLTLTDPDGGGTTTTIQATTKVYPTETSNYQYVAPGNGGGNGTSATPYLGLQTAANNAQPGTTFIVRPGTYSSFNVGTDGTANAPITFRSETPHAAIVDGGNTSGGVIILGDFTTDSLQHIIIDGFKIQNGNYGIDAQHTQFITIKNCWIENVVWGFYNRRENGWEHDQYITNNYIEGRTDWTNGGTSHRAIDIRGNRNVISFNTIRDFDDGVSTDGTPYGISYAMDIHNNDIQNMADDLIEVDGTVSNTRIYCNRMYNARAGVSLAPVFGGPCYIFRNEMYNMREGFSAYKMNRSPAGLVMVHNSSAKIGNGMSSPTGWQNTFFKNNVVMGTSYCFEEYELVSGSIINDWDYNAYHSTRPANNVLGEQWFKWDDVRYGNLVELQAGTNIETNGVIFNPNNDIVDVAFPANDDTEYIPDDVDFQPTSGSAFRNNGIQLDNLNDEYVTDGQPDRGAYEFGSPLPQFGADVTLPQVGDGLTAGIIKVDATFEHIGILYNISGDGNLNSSLQIEFREQGNGAYQNGAITMRSHPGLVIDGSIFNANHHAGSAMFLRPNTTYDIRLTLTDPDGGGTTTTIQATTKVYPTETSNYQYVAPGNGGGNGTSATPYLGLQTAANNAQPGTTFIVRPGTYSSFNVGTDGTANAPITFRSETPHAAIVDGGNTSGGVIILGDFTTDSLQHIIIDGFKIQNGSIGIDAQHTQFITIKNCWIEDVVWGFYNRRENGWEHDQYLTNNYMNGRADWLNGGTSDRGIDIRGNRNVVSFNTIRNFDDGVSTDGPPYALSYAMDIHNNDIQNMADDLIEVDGTISNTRVYRNRMYNARAGVSLAPVYGGPCYAFRNELYNMADGFSTYKMNRGPSGLVIVHNSSSKIGNGMSSPVGWQNTFFKNNVVMGTRYCFEEFGLVDGSVDDWDYNAYLSTRAGIPGDEWFKWDDVRYATISDLQNGTDIETNGLAITNLGLINAAPPTNYAIEYNYDDTSFQPYNAADVRNNGINLDNLNDGFVFDGMPDQGAYEYANTLPKFGVDFGCKIAMPLSIELESDQILFNPYYNYYGDLLYIEGLRREYTIKVADENGNEIPSFIDGANRIVIASCPYINSKYYLIITHNTQPDVKAEIWLNE